ncbi:MAG: hypothetical protein ACFFDN_02730 [Candidatus Hodarchaeota archaeon]
MTKTDIKKCIAFIKANASEVPAATRGGNEWVIPEEIVAELKSQIEKTEDNRFAINKEDFNRQFGWKPESNHTNTLTKKLNKQYPLENENLEWHVGRVSSDTMYKFSYREKKGD